MADLRMNSMTELQNQLRSNSITSRQIVDRYIDAINRVNPKINAVVETCFESARIQADEADRQRQQTPNNLPPLHGIPCTVKECFAVSGMKRTSGLKSRANAVMSEDADVVRRVKEAGAIILGTTNVSELCMWYESRNRVYGISRNPYDPSRIVGGSSGGEAAIVSAAGSPIGIGSDIGGSIRMPAFFNGIFGHKPSYGLVDNTGAFPLPSNQTAMEMLTPGPLARYAEDLMPFLKVISQKPDQLGNPDDVVPENIRIISVPESGLHHVSNRLRNVQAKLGNQLAHASHTVETKLYPEFKRAIRIWGARMLYGRNDSFKSMLFDGQKCSMLVENLRWLTRQSDFTSTSMFLANTEFLNRFFNDSMQAKIAEGESLRERIIDDLGDDGLMIYPSFGHVAPKHYSPLLTPFSFAHTALFNTLRLPVTQVPLGLDDRGLPLGIQVIAPPMQDHRSIAFAKYLSKFGAGWVPPSISRD
jgi:fatty acid amide hydrolase 2